MLICNILAFNIKRVGMSFWYQSISLDIKKEKSININYPLDDGRFFFKMAAVFFEMYKMSVLGIKECINWYPIKKR